MSDGSAAKAGGAAIAAVLIAGASFYFGTVQSENSAQFERLRFIVDNFYTTYGTCESFQNRVLGLEERGLNRRQIEEIVNAEDAPDVDQIESALPADDPLEALADVDEGPAYDFLYEKSCGDIGPLLRYSKSNPRRK